MFFLLCELGFFCCQKSFFCCHILTWWLAISRGSLEAGLGQNLRLKFLNSQYPYMVNQKRRIFKITSPSYRFFQGSKNITQVFQSPGFCFFCWPFDFSVLASSAGHRSQVPQRGRRPGRPGGAEMRLGRPGESWPATAMFWDGFVGLL